MIWACNKYLGGIRIQAEPKIKAFCPLCREEVIAKCGEIKIWHFAHKRNFECDSFGEPETEWHLKFKNYFPEEFQEVIIKNHRADILTTEYFMNTKIPLVIELQNSPISSKQIREREEFYGNIIWIINGEKYKENLCWNGGTLWKWKYFPKCWDFSNKRIYIELSERLFLLKKTESEKWGKKYYNCNLIPHSKEAFIIQNGGKIWKN